MPSRVLHDEQELEAWCKFLVAQPLPMTVSQTRGARRSLPQNATFHMWTSQIAAETGQSAAEAKAEVKLRYGLPIMEAEHPAWVAEWEPLYGPLTYQQRLKLFEVLPLTSRLTTRQMASLMDAVMRDYRAMGIQLRDPEALKYAKEFEA